MQLQKLIAKLVGAEIGDKVLLPLELSGHFGDQAAAKFFALMISEMESTHVDLATNSLIHNNSTIPLQAFGIDPESLVVNLEYTLDSTYDEPNGKFSLILSNSAIIDCNYVFPQFIGQLETSLDAIKDQYPEFYDEAE